MISVIVSHDHNSEIIWIWCSLSQILPGWLPSFPTTGARVRIRKAIDCRVDATLFFLDLHPNHARRFGTQCRLSPSAIPLPPPWIIPPLRWLNGERFLHQRSILVMGWPKNWESSKGILNCGSCRKNLPLIMLWWKKNLALMPSETSCPEVLMIQCPFCQARKDIEFW